MNIRQNQEQSSVRLFEPGVHRRVDLIVHGGDREHLVPGTNVTMDELHRYQLVGRQLQARAMAAAISGLFRGARRFIAKLVTGVRQARLQAAAVSELAAMDDRLLADIGIRRDNIEAAVAGLMSRQAAAEAAPVRSVPATAPRRAPVCNQSQGKAAA